MFFNKVYRGIFLSVTLFFIQLVAQIYLVAQAETFSSTGTLSYQNIVFQFIPEDAGKIPHPETLIKQVQSFYDAYKSMLGDTPFDGKQLRFVERCNAENGKSATTITKECPNGYALGYWGYFEGTPDITITKAGINDVITDNAHDVVTFGLVHELSHAFDHWDNAQYVYNTTSAEALANIKLVHALDITGIKVRLGSTTYSSTGEFLNNFYMPFYDTYRNNHYTFDDLDDDNPVVGSKADMHMALLEKGIQATSGQCFFDTLKQYPASSHLEKLDQNNKAEKFEQFLSLWSEQCQSNALIHIFSSAHFPVPSPIEIKTAGLAPIISSPIPVFTDIKGHFAEQAIITLSQKRIVTGKTSTLFAPNNPLNRAEAAKLITTAFLPSKSAEDFIQTLKEKHPNYTYVFFKDVDIQSWFAGYVGIMQSYGIVQGSVQKIYNPDKPISRAEFLKMILRTRGDNIEYLSNQYISGNEHIFSDISQKAWYYPIIYAGVKLGIVEPQERFNPEKAITRGEAAVMLMRSV